MQKSISSEKRISSIPAYRKDLSKFEVNSMKTKNSPPKRRKENNIFIITGKISKSELSKKPFIKFLAFLNVIKELNYLILFGKGPSVYLTITK
jgi:hypothetical protein